MHGDVVVTGKRCPCCGSTAGLFRTYANGDATCTLCLRSPRHTCGRCWDHCGCEDGPSREGMGVVVDHCRCDVDWLQEGVVWHHTAACMDATWAPQCRATVPRGTVGDA